MYQATECAANGRRCDKIEKNVSCEKCGKIKSIRSRDFSFKFPDLVSKVSVKGYASKEIIDMICKA